MKFYIKTLGCDKNTCDSENLIGALIGAGHLLAENPENADILLVNTCSFIKDAKVQSIEAIFDLVAGKKAGQRLFVLGCLPQRYAQELKKSLPEADGLFGVNNFDEILKAFQTSEKQVFADRAPKVYNEFGCRVVQSDKPWSAPVKISEGCRNVCTYCAIPFIRGGFRSRKQENILAEVRGLTKQGVKELLIVGQDVTAYGMDFKDGSNLAGLLRQICKVPGIEWVRLMYCYEDEITDELIQTIKDEPKICKYIDIPLQHYSNKILKLMNRRSTEESIEKTIAKLRAQIPDIAIRTTFITGFPGEFKEDFSKLYNFVERTEFARLGVFTYSKEEGTKAAKMPSQVKEDAKQRRCDKIMQLQQQISLKNNEKLVGKTLQVIIDEDPGDGTYICRTRYDAPDIDNGVILTSQRKLNPGQIVDVLICDAFDYDLCGKEIINDTSK